MRAKLAEELAELEQARREGDEARVRDEMGDVLFSIVNFARALGIDAETALRDANEKFYRRFTFMEQRARSEGRALERPDARRIGGAVAAGEIAGGVTIRVRMSAHDAHYGGNLVDGARILGLFGDVATELLDPHDGDEGLFVAYDLVEFKAPVHAGDYIEAERHASPRPERPRARWSSKRAK